MSRKYSYSRAGLKGLTPFPFLGEVKTRLKAIEEAPDTMPQTVFSANALASALHPSVQMARVRSITEHKGAKSFVLEPDRKNGTEKLAYFRAGQYVSVSLSIGKAVVNKPYTIASNPKDALEDGTYTLTVKESAAGYASRYILDNWKVGTEVKMSGPLGEFYHQDLRDSGNVIAIAGGSGITPFFSMASAIKDGIEDFSLTILYGSRTSDSILLRDELEEAASASNGKVRIIHVLSDEEKQGYEHGFISSDIIRKYAPEGEYSVFVCGPSALYAYERKEIERLSLRPRFVRYELSGDSVIAGRDDAFPAEARNREFSLTVVIRGQKTLVRAKSEEPLLWAMEREGIKAPSHCRSGVCGWCHSRLIEGNVYIPSDRDGRRLADRKFGWIHPCASYPLSDVVLEVYPAED